MATFSQLLLESGNLAKNKTMQHYSFAQNFHFGTVRGSFVCLFGFVFYTQCKIFLPLRKKSGSIIPFFFRRHIPNPLLPGK